MTKSNLLLARMQGIGLPSLSAIIWSNSSFQLAASSSDYGSVMSQTKRAPDAPLQKVLFIAAKFVSIPTRSHNYRRISLPYKFKCFIWKSAEIVAL